MLITHHLKTLRPLPLDEKDTGRSHMENTLCLPAQSLKAASQRSVGKHPSEEREKQAKAADEAFAAAVRGCGEIAATMDEEMFNMVVSRWREYADTIKEGKEFTALAAAGALLKDMVRSGVGKDRRVLHVWKKCPLEGFWKDTGVSIQLVVLTVRHKFRTYWFTIAIGANREAPSCLRTA